MTKTYDEEWLYEKCAHCHLFVQPKDYGADSDYEHLHRGDAADDALDQSHNPEPSGMKANLSVWEKFGPKKMRERFVDTRNYRADPMNVYTGACFIEHSRMGSTVYVGPFTSVNKARKWIKKFDRESGWMIVLLQDPKHPDTPEW